MFRNPFLLLVSACFALALAAGCGGGDGTESTAPTPPEETPPMTPSEPAATEPDPMDPEGPVVSMETTLGEIRIQLYPEQAPITVENFLQYVEDGFYAGTIFHRVVRGFVIQGGGLTADMQEKPNRDPIRNEADNGLRNGRGWLSMARTSDPHSATSQFFINTVDNPVLDFTSQTPRGWGYAVFGRVISGMDVVDQIEASPVVSRAGFNDVPRDVVEIRSATVISR